MWNRYNVCWIQYATIEINEKKNLRFNLLKLDQVKL